MTDRTPHPSEQPRTAAMIESVREGLRVTRDDKTGQWQQNGVLMCSAPASWFDGTIGYLGAIIRQAEAAAPDPVASNEFMLHCGKCQHPMHWKECGADADLTAPCRCRNDVATLAHSPMVHDPNASLYAPVASPAPLDVERLAEVLWSLRPKVRDKSEADRVSKWIAAEYARLEGQPVAESPDAD